MPMGPPGTHKVRGTKPVTHAKRPCPKACFTLKTQLFSNNQYLRASSYYLFKVRPQLVYIFSFKSIMFYMQSKNISSADFLDTGAV